MVLSGRPAAALIVEAQPFAGMVASDILKETGFETYHAFGADDALAILRSHPEIELLVTEAELSGPVDGLELTRRVSAERPDIRVVVTSGGMRFPTFDVPGGARLLRKPYASSELRSVVGGMALLQDA